jgi:hypothetical protein
MEGGRQIEASKEILTAKNIPYFVAAPLLIQSTETWMKSGVQGLQTVVLYSLPELDGAIETVVLGNYPHSIIVLLTSLCYYYYFLGIFIIIIIIISTIINIIITITIINQYYFHLLLISCFDRNCGAR